MDKCLCFTSFIATQLCQYLLRMHLPSIKFNSSFLFLEFETKKKEIQIKHLFLSRLFPHLLVFFNRILEFHSKTVSNWEEIICIFLILSLESSFKKKAIRISLCLLEFCNGRCVIFSLLNYRSLKRIMIHKSKGMILSFIECWKQKRKERKLKREIEKEEGYILSLRRSRLKTKEMIELSSLRFV